MLTWLHVSDFHIRAGGSYDRSVVLRALVDSVRRLRGEGHVPSLVFATGDIAHSGKPAEYEQATTFFEELLDAVGVDRSALFVIPGNHDVDRDLGIGLARTLSDREEADAYFDPSRPKPHISLKQAAFWEWYSEFFAGIRECPTTSCGPVETVEIEGRRIGVLPINSALFCQDDHDHAKLWIGRRALDDAMRDLEERECDVRLALVHHPLSWLHDAEGASIRAALASSVDVVLRGHLHETDVEQVVSHHGQTINIAAGAAYQTRRWPNRALYGTVDGSSVRIFPIRFEDSPVEIWTVDPSVFPTAADHSETFQLHQADAPRAETIKGSAVVAPRFRSNVPSRRGLPFVGRDDELREMSEALTDRSQDQVLVLSGPPGAGKSELAREYARQQRERYPGGTFIVDATSSSVVVDLARLGLNQLGLEFPLQMALEDQAQRSLVTLASAPTLLIYDNVRSFDAVEPWLPPAGMPCHVVITTVRQPRAPGWRTLSVEPLTPEDSIGLVAALAGPEVAGTYGSELASSSGGLPVQLCPAAAILAYELRRGRGGGEHAIKVTEETRASFSLVYDHLEEPVRLLLHAAAGLNPQRIDPSELGTHLAAMDWTPHDVDTALDICVDLHVLQGDVDLRMHQLFAAFLHSIKPSEDLIAAVKTVREAQRGRLIEIACDLSEEPADARLAAALTGYRLDPSGWEQDGVRFGAGEYHVVGFALLEIAEPERACEWLMRAVEQKRRGKRTEEDPDIGLVFHQLGDAHDQMGDFTQAREWYERAVQVKRKPEQEGEEVPVDRVSLGKSLAQIGLTYVRTGDYERARTFYEEAVTECEQGQPDGKVDSSALGSALHQVGTCFAGLGEFDKARGWYERAIEAKRRGKLEGQVIEDSLATSLNSLGVTYARTNRFGEAQPFFEEAAELARMGDAFGRVDHEKLGRILHELGDCHFNAGNADDARGCYEQAADEKRLGDALGRVDHESLGRSLHQVGQCYLVLSKKDAARDYFIRATGEKKNGDVHGRLDHGSIGESLYSVGECDLQALRLERARDGFCEARDEMRRGDIHGRVDHSRVGVCLLALGCSRI